MWFQINPTTNERGQSSQSYLISLWSDYSKLLKNSRKKMSDVREIFEYFHRIVRCCIKATLWSIVNKKMRILLRTWIVKIPLNLLIEQCLMRCNINDRKLQCKQIMCCKVYWNFQDLTNCHTIKTLIFMQAKTYFVLMDRFHSSIITHFLIIH